MRISIIVESAYCSTIPSTEAYSPLLYKSFMKQCKSIFVIQPRLSYIWILSWNSGGNKPDQENRGDSYRTVLSARYNLSVRSSMSFFKAGINSSAENSPAVINESVPVKSEAKWSPNLGVITISAFARASLFAPCIIIVVIWSAISQGALSLLFGLSGLTKSTAIIISAFSAMATSTGRLSTKPPSRSCIESRGTLLNINGTDMLARNASVISPRSITILFPVTRSVVTARNGIRRSSKLGLGW